MFKAKNMSQRALRFYYAVKIIKETLDNFHFHVRFTVNGKVSNQRHDSVEEKRKSYVLRIRWHVTPLKHKFIRERAWPHETLIFGNKMVLHHRNFPFSNYYFIFIDSQMLR